VTTSALFPASLPSRGLWDENGAGKGLRPGARAVLCCLRSVIAEEEIAYH